MGFYQLIEKRPSGVTATHLDRIVCHNVLCTGTFLFDSGPGHASRRLVALSPHLSCSRDAPSFMYCKSGLSDIPLFSWGTTRICSTFSATLNFRDCSWVGCRSQEYPAYGPLEVASTKDCPACATLTPRKMPTPIYGDSCHMLHRSCIRYINRLTKAFQVGCA